MQIDDTHWTYNEFLAFLLVYGAQMTAEVSAEEKAFIQSRTGIDNIDKIVRQIENMSDIEAIEVIDDYKNRFLQTADKEEKVRHDLEDLLKANNKPSQLDNVVIHILEKLV